MGFALAKLGGSSPVKLEDNILLYGYKMKIAEQKQKIKKEQVIRLALFYGVSDGIRTHGLQGHNLAL